MENNQEAIESIQKRLMGDILENLGYLSREQRNEIFSLIKEKYCITCGDSSSICYGCEYDHDQREEYPE
jgi:hypothetical protein